MEGTTKKRVGNRWRTARTRECPWCKKEFLATITEINKLFEKAHLPLYNRTYLKRDLSISYN